MSYLYLCLAIFSTSIGMIFYKLFFITKKKVYFFVTLVLFLLTPGLSFLSLKGLSVDVVYMATSLNSFIIIIGSYFFLKEKVNVYQYSGCLLIALGVILYMV
ncbi:EamA family transporter [Vibrio sp. MA40-2]|uniref:EamA family transporter n=1 Tax=Vibrio sp. MA40-2 TaxID=3391828 RepID=UPI0039A4CC63